MRRRVLLRSGLAAALLVVSLPALASSGPGGVSPDLDTVLAGPLALGDDQVPRWSDNLLDVGDQWIAFARGGDASVPPTTDIDDVPWVVPVYFGLNVVNFQDPGRLPDLGGFEVVDGRLQGAVNGGPRVGPNFVVMTAVMAAPIPLDTESAQIDFVLQIPGLDQWEALPQFPDDTWNNGSLVLSLRGSGGDWSLVYITFPNGVITERPFPGFGFIAGDTVVVGVEADSSLFAPESFQGAPTAGSTNRWFGAAGAGTSTLALEGKLAIDTPGLVMAAPGTRDDYFDYLGSTVPIVPGLPDLFDVPDFDIFVDEDGELWIKLYPRTPWGSTPPEQYFSDYMQWALRPLGSDVPPVYGGFQTHDGESETFSGSGSEAGDPIEGYIMGPDGALLFRTGVPYEGSGLEVFVQAGFLRVEGGPFLYSRRVTFVPDDEVGFGDEPTEFDDEFPIWDLNTGTPVEPPAVTVTTTTTAPASTVTTTTVPASTVTSQPGTTTRPPTVTQSGETCWWCWGILVFFVAFLVTILCLFVKTYEWWTAWIFWFIVIFVWVPFLLAGLWFWGPTWWWWPLLAWFPLIGGYTWWWARRRSWWRPWMLYAVGVYLVGLGVGLFIVGSPTWGLLFPLFWLPPVAFYLWYRAPRRVWWRPWLYGVFLGYVAWIFVWVIWLTPWWAWWYPVVLLGIVGWWVVSNGGNWRMIIGPKWCWAIPFACIPFLAWWILLWDPWWCFVIVAFFGLSLFCVIFNHYKQQEWWSCWIPWFLIIFTGVPFLLAGLFFFGPSWWWWPLLAWFPIIGGYTWWWARRRSWWQPWMLYIALGYLVALAIGMFVVGAPEWWLLFPFFWLPPVAFYLWYRGRRQTWWQPWMYGGFLLWAGGVLLWVAVGNPSPWWAWWYPPVFLGVLGWWFLGHGYGSALAARKASWIVPCGLLPWFAFMLAIECLPA